MADNDQNQQQGGDQNQQQGGDQSLLTGGDQNQQQGGDQNQQQAEVDYASIDYGEGVQVDTELLNTYAPQLKDAGFTEDQMKAAVPMMNEIMSKQAQAQVDAFTQQQTADREVIGKIAPEDMAAAKTAMEKVFGEDPEAMAALNGRYGDLPWVVNGLVKIGKMMSGDGFIEGAGGGGPSKPAEQVLFPSMQQG